MQHTLVDFISVFTTCKLYIQNIVMVCYSGTSKRYRRNETKDSSCCKASSGWLLSTRAVTFKLHMWQVSK